MEVDDDISTGDVEIDDEVKTQATQVLRKGLKNDDAELTKAQLEVIRGILEGRNVLYIDKTGAGKSETYFVATKLLRERNDKPGPVIVVTPLVALIEDQVRRAKGFGLKAFGYYSKQKGMTEAEQSVVWTAMSKNTLDLLFLTAEMLSEISEDNRSFINQQGREITYIPKLLENGPALKLHPPKLSTCPWEYVPLLVIDEIHYISDAGHDFRLDYLQVWSKFENHQWFIRARKLGLTATVNSRVLQSLQYALPDIEKWQKTLGNLYRENITLRILQKPKNDAARVDYVRKLYHQDPKANILVFCRSIKDAKQFSDDISKGPEGVPPVSVGFYYSPLKSDAELFKKLKNNEKAFRMGTTRVLFATCALGLGYDKSDIHHVVHLWTPNSIVQYYQEFGRAGRWRTGESAKAHMLPTSPWNSTSSWVAVLSDICWFLGKKKASKYTASVAEIKDRECARKAKESEVDRAIELGVNKKMLKCIGDTVRLLDAQENLQKMDSLYAEEMKNDMEVMRRFSRNCGQNHPCLWKFILDQFEGEKIPDLICRKCSGKECDPGGDTESSAEAGGNIFYQVIAPKSRVPIFALNKVGEQLELDEERLKEIFSMHHPSMVLEPPGKWTICPIPDSAGDNEREAALYAEFLNGMEVSTFIQKNPEEQRKVTNAASSAQRRDILKSKFIFDWDQMPTIGNLLLYDDRVSSGDTIDKIVQEIRAHRSDPMDVAVLTKFVYTGSKTDSPEVRRLFADKLGSGELEQPAQQ